MPRASYLRTTVLMGVIGASVLRACGGLGWVIEPENSLIAIGSGAPYAKSAALALLENTDLDARTITEKALTIAAAVCIYTNNNFTIEELE